MVCLLIKISYSVFAHGNEGAAVRLMDAILIILGQQWSCMALFWYADMHMFSDCSGVFMAFVLSFI